MMLLELSVLTYTLYYTLLVCCNISKIFANLAYGAYITKQAPITTELSEYHYFFNWPSFGLRIISQSSNFFNSNNHSNQINLKNLEALYMSINVNCKLENFNFLCFKKNTKTYT